MSQSSVGGGGNGPDFDMPEEILAVIPTDPYDQLDLARKITSMAIASRVSKLESDAGRTCQKLQEKDRVILELEDEVGRLQQAYQGAESRLKTVLDDNMKLTKERDSLAMTTKKLNRDLAKLETFKRQLMQSLNDDNSPQAESVDIRTCDQSVPRAYPDDVRNDHASQHSFNGSSNIPNSNDALRNAQRFSITPYITPRFTPTGTPKVISTAGTPRKTSGATSPARSLYDGRGSLSSWYPSSHQSSAANSPPRNRSLPARAPRIDGKEFFRQARSRLSYEQFSAFLANIKELNAQKQTREDTLRKAEEIFGMENKDLYLSFQGLLTRKIN